jgi:hypothetical protein
MHPRKEDSDKTSTSRGIVTTQSSPKYRTIERSSIVIKKESRMRKDAEVGSTAIVTRPLLQNADPSIVLTEAGNKMNSSESHSEKAYDSISETVETSSNAIERIHLHPENAFWQIFATRRGMITLKSRPKCLSNELPAALSSELP